jgi:hypothetical protein
MNTFTDILLARPPLLILVEPDGLWVRHLVSRAIGHLPKEDQGHLLRWTPSAGWTGADHLVRTSGLPQISAAKRKEADPVEHVQSLLTWFEALTEQKRQGRKSPFERGVVLVQDLGPFLDEPAMSSILAELYGASQDLGISVFIVVPSPLVPGHALHGVLPQLRLPPDVDERYGAVAGDIAERHGASDEERRQVIRALCGLPVAALAVLGHLVELEMAKGEGRPLASVVASVATFLRPRPE